MEKEEKEEDEINILEQKIEKLAVIHKKDT